MFVIVAARIAESDCENLATGVLAQPVNTLSSLAYAAVGIAIVVWAFAAQGQNRTQRLSFGVLMVGAGAGSVLFHGPQWQGSQFIHDITFLIALVYLAVVNITAARSTITRNIWLYFLPVVAILGIALALSPTSTNVLMIAVVAAVVAADIALFRKRERWGAWYITGLVAGGFALLMFIVGRTDGPLCDPTSVFQGHGVWHVFGAVALGAYFVATTSVRESRTDRVPA